MNKKRLLYIVGVLLIIAVVIYLTVISGSEEAEVVINAPVKYGKFEIVVTTTGELQAENSEKIRGPSGLRRIRVYNVKITDLVAEGTVIDSGDYVATLDRTEAETRLKDIESNLQQIESQYTETRLDTTMEMRNARDELVNLKYSMEEAKIVMEQSIYEPPATIRQAKISYEKAERAYNQALENYKLKEQKSQAKMVEASSSLAREERVRDELMDVLDDFIVKAPKPGMVIYQKEWNGAKRKVGSTVSAWDPVVATLPDLSSMISKTYVNEIDISKLEKGMKVDIGIDAFPDRHYTGKITDIANIGEQLPNSDAKVFEVLIKVNESDSIMRPSMTTSNSVKVAEYDSVLFVPLESVHSNDSLTYVFVNSGLTYERKEVELGPSNENEVIIRRGLNQSDIVLLTKPEDAESYALVRLKNAEGAE